MTLAKKKLYEAMASYGKQTPLQLIMLLPTSHLGCDWLTLEISESAGESTQLAKRGPKILLRTQGNSATRPAVRVTTISWPGGSKDCFAGGESLVPRAPRFRPMGTGAAGACAEAWRAARSRRTKGIGAHASP